MTDTAKLELDARAALGEGPIWDHRKQVLYWVNILGRELRVYHPSSRRDRTIALNQYVGTVVPRRAGGVMLAVHHGFARLDLRTRRLRIVCDPQPAGANTRFNDGKCDPAGRFWAGTMSLGGTPRAGSLYCLDPDRTVRRMVRGVTVSNGIAWSLDHRQMYYIDTPTQRVDAFDYDLRTGAIRRRRAAVRIPDGQGYPDGMTIDAEGMLWVAHWGGWRVTRWNPRTGRLLKTIHVPASQVTACAFGGPRLDRLYITTARQGLNGQALAKQPHAGGLFLARPGVRGVPVDEFAG